MAPVVAIIAPGLMGSAVARLMRSNGATVLTSTEGRSRTTIDRAREAGMVAASDERIAAEANIVFSILPPANAVDLARRLRWAIARGSQRPLYVDCNAISPARTREVQAALGVDDQKFVDAGIVGGPPAPGGKSPRFYLSGPSAATVADIAAFGVDMRVLEGPIGAASALKLSYAGITKGLTALAATMVMAASRADVLPALADELAASQPALLKRFAQAIPDMLPKAHRWIGEMEEIAAFVGSEHPEHVAYRAAAELYRRLAAAPADEVAVLERFVADLG